MCVAVSINMLYTFCCCKMTIVLFGFYYTYPIVFNQHNCSTDNKTLVSLSLTRKAYVFNRILLRPRLCNAMFLHNLLMAHIL